MRVRFCQMENMAPFPRENLLDGVFTGADADYAQDNINRYLEDQDDHRRVLQPFHAMTPQTRWAFLVLATHHSSWTSDHEPYLLEINSQRLDEFLRDHPLAAQPFDET